MLGTLLTVHHRDGQNLPRGRSKLYQRYLDGMLGAWEQRIRVTRDVALTPDQKRYLLQRTATYFLLNSVESLGEQDAPPLVGMTEIIRETLAEMGALASNDVNAYSSRVLSELRERTGMLDGPGTYSFVHKSVAEFLFAEILNEGHLRDPEGERIDRQWIFARRHDDRWRGVLFFWAGLAAKADVQGFIETLLERAECEDILLAFALLQDQMERLTLYWVRSTFANICKTYLPVCSEDFSSCKISGTAPVLTEGFTIPHVLLPSLNAIGGAHAFLYVARYVALDLAVRADLPTPWAHWAWWAATLPDASDDELLSAIGQPLSEYGIGYSTYCSQIVIRRAFARAGCREIWLEHLDALNKLGTIKACVIPWSSLGLLAIPRINDDSALEVAMAFLDCFPWIIAKPIDPDHLIRSETCRPAMPGKALDILDHAMRHFEGLERDRGLQHENLQVCKRWIDSLKDRRALLASSQKGGE